MTITFIHPPLDDPTLPYHSTAYLRGHLAQHGFTDVFTRDLNAEFVNYCLEDRVGEAFREEADRRLAALRSRPTLTFEEQEAFYALWTTQASTVASGRAGAASLRDKAAFLHYDTYRDSVKQVEAYFQLIGALCYPASLSAFRMMSRGRFSIYNLRDLFNVDLARQICYPLERFFADRCVADPGLRASDCLGISIVYDHQLLTAVHLARLIKARWPDKLILLGGTSITQCFKYLRDKTLMKHFFRVCDGVVVGEGETAMCAIAAANGDIAGRRDIPNLITYDAASDVVHLPARIHYEYVAKLGRPVYDAPWNLYLAPERAINYSPTRGCYWNRCTFCDYGLNTDRPTSPWREKPVDAVVDDLRRIRDEEGIRYVYFAVDVMAPGYLERLSDALDEARLDLRWSAEVRMERIFSKERCVKLARSGCVSISFGMESGNQRILDLIDKGTKVAYMGETMKHFAEAGIAVQLMAFSHFPTETAAERQDTIEFAARHKAYWSSGGIGRFVLTGTALVAKHPEKFGITLIEAQNADIVRTVGYETTKAGEREMLSAEDGDESFDDPGSLFPKVPRRPWAGSTDALHSMIYYAEHGRTFFKEHCPATAVRPASGDTHPSAAALDEPIAVVGTLLACDHAIGEILGHRGQFRDAVQTLRQAAVEPTYDEFRRWQQGIPAVSADLARRSYWIVQDGRCLQLAHVVYDLLRHALQMALPLSHLLHDFDPALRARLAEYFVLLERRSYIAPARDLVPHAGAPSGGRVPEAGLAVPAHAGLASGHP